MSRGIGKMPIKNSRYLFHLETFDLLHVSAIFALGILPGSLIERRDIPSLLQTTRSIPGISLFFKKDT